MSAAVYRDAELFRALADPTRREGRYRYFQIDTRPLRAIAWRWATEERG